MELAESHHTILGMRTYLNKFAISVGYTGTLADAVTDLIENGYVTKIDTCHLGVAGGRLMNIYELTEAGIALVEKENIVAVSP